MKQPPGAPLYLTTLRKNSLKRLSGARFYILSEFHGIPIGIVNILCAKYTLILRIYLISFYSLRNRPRWLYDLLVNTGSPGGIKVKDLVVPL